MVKKRSGHPSLPPQDPVWKKHYERYQRETGDPDVAADLTQELVLKVLYYQSRVGQSRPVTLHDLEGLLNAAHAQVFVDWLRRKYRTPQLQPLDDEDGPEPVDPAPGAEDRLGPEEWREQVREELADLPLTKRQRRLLKYLDEKASRVARKTRTSPAAVRRRRSDLYQHLRRNRRLRRLYRQLTRP